ncbi:MAG: DUF362 domain-containing protein [Gluconacetobacter diazotrophicus]|nr:DUF362 domain-containing protein [Gluconacetobacter diazotrophicus]
MRAIVLVFLLLAGVPAVRGEAETPANKTPQAPARSFVYTAHDAAAIEHFETNRSRVHSMVDRLVAATTGKESAAAGWRSLVEPKDIVGIKISAAGGAEGSTHRAVVQAIVDGLEEAGVPKANILVWDRDAEDLHAAGYLARDEHTPTFDCNVLAIEPKYGYDAKHIFRSPVLGKLIWGDLMFVGNPVPADLGLHDEIDGTVRSPLEAIRGRSPAAANPADSPASALPGTKKNIRDENLSTESHYCTILTRRVTKVVNVPVYADNIYVGIGGALYNVTIPNIDNWRRLVAPPHYGASAIPEIYSDPDVGGKVVLNLVDGLVAQIAGAPTFQPLYAKHHATLYASRDAVAVDATLLRQLETWRKEAQLPALGETAGHVQAAGDEGLGNATPDKIEVRSVNP